MILCYSALTNRTKFVDGLTVRVTGPVWPGLSAAIMARLSLSACTGEEPEHAGSVYTIKRSKPPK